VGSSVLFVRFLRVLLLLQYVSVFSILCDVPTEEFLLISVVVLRQGAEHYKNLCREKRFVVRPFKFDPAEDKAEKERKEQLATKKKKLWVRSICSRVFLRSQLLFRRCTCCADVVSCVLFFSAFPACCSEFLDPLVHDDVQ
jgi:hypothetical protein